MVHRRPPIAACQCCCGSPSRPSLYPSTVNPRPKISLQNPDLNLRLKLPRAGSDLGASEFGRVRKKTLKAEEAGGGMEGAMARLAEAEAEAAARRRKAHGGSGGGGGGGGGGHTERWPPISTAPASLPRPLWPPGTERPPAGREGSHTRSVAAAERLVDSCIGATPLEGIAAAVLLRRRAASSAPGSRGG